MKAIASVPVPSRLVCCPRDTSVCMEPSGILDSVGHTPLVLLRRASEDTGCTILAKCEYMNPGGSIKDRIAKAIVDRAEARGELRPGMTILEVTSGNTGIALSMVGAARGYRVIIMMPKTASEERRHMIRALGAELVLLDDLLRIQGAVAECEARARLDRSIFLPRQFSNPDNPWAHEMGTGPEILRQTRGGLDAFVMGVGTGGTVVGVGRALKAASSAARVVAVEPAESAVMSGGAAGHHGIQGLADGFIPQIVLDAGLRADSANLADSTAGPVVPNTGPVIDEVVRVPTADAKSMAARLSHEEGMLVGISAGANVVASMAVARRLGPGHTIVTMLCDRGERYLSLAL
jgi:cysteine synthase A